MRLWTSSAEAKLRALYPDTPLPRIAFLLKRTQKAIKSRAALLGLTKKDYCPWLDLEDELLRRLYPDMATDEIARKLDRPRTAVYGRAATLGLKKSEAFLASDKAGRIQRGRLNPRMVANQFKKGQTPRNKGLRRPGWAPGRMASTQFKKGERRGAAACNYVPIGSQRINSKDGYLEQKVTDDHPVPARRWVAVHRLVWEAAHGPIPAGRRVAFKPGMKTSVESELTVDRLELVTAADLMRRNSIHQYPKEVVRATQLRGALNRQINKIIKRETR